MSSGSPSALSPLAADMRAQDPDRYLATLFAPADVREALFALYAFDHEIAKVRRLVREPMAGLIRFQWWRDALDSIEAGDIFAHPVVAGLSDAINGHGLDRGFLEAAIDGREREMEEGPPETLAAFEQHLAATNGGIARAAVTMLGGDQSEVLSVANRLGLSLGILEKLRWLRAARGDLPLWLPKALLARHDLAGDVLETGQEGHQTCRAKVNGLQIELADLAQEHLVEARKEQALISRRLLPAFFPGTLAEVRLRDLGRPEQHPALATAPYRLSWHWLRGRF